MASTTSTSVSSQSTIAENVITSMNRALGDLRTTLGSLNEETVQNIRQSGEQYIDHELRGINAKMRASDDQQKAEVAELNELVRQVLEEELIAKLTEIIQADVLQEIDDLVKAQVQLQLPQYLPNELQEEVKRHKEELARLEIELQNAESVRQNAALVMDPDLELHQLYTPRGAVSKHFPSTLGDLFNMTEQTAVLLLHDYGLPIDTASSREKNVNEFMRLCGVRYLLTSVNGGPAVPRSPTTGTTAGGGQR